MAIIGERFLYRMRFLSYDPNTPTATAKESFTMFAKVSDFLLDWAPAVLIALLPVACIIDYIAK